MRLVTGGKLVRDYFVHNLQPTLKSAVLTIQSTKLEDVVNAALMAESMAATSKAVTSQMQSSKFRPSFKSKAQIKCYFCHQNGHIKPDCPKLKKSEKRTTQKLDTVVSFASVSFRFLLPVELENGLRQHWMIDCGGQTSCLPSRLFSPVRPKDKGMVLKAANGSVINIQGMRSLGFKFGHASYVHLFPVVDIEGWPILGMDLLKKTGAIVDFLQGTLRTHDGEILKLFPEDDLQLSENKISASEPKEVFKEDVSSIMNGASLFSNDVRETIDEDCEESKWFIEVASVNSKCLVSEQDTVTELGVNEDVENYVHNDDLDSLLQEFNDLFTTTVAGSGTVGEHTILTESASPIAQRPYRIPKAYEEKVEQKIKELLNNDFIRESSSSWCSPLVVVKKKDCDDVRLCVDVRKLNIVSPNQIAILYLSLRTCYVKLMVPSLRLSIATN